MRRNQQYYGPPIPVVVDRLRREKSEKTGEGYWRFNVLIDTPWTEFVSLGWRFQGEKIYSPAMHYNGKFYTMNRVGRGTAQAIYKEVIRKVGEREGRVIPWNDAGWKPPIIGESSLHRSFPEYSFEKFGVGNRSEPIEDDVPDSPEPIAQPDPRSLTLPDWDTRRSWTTVQWDEYEAKKQAFINGAGE
jgi:hypothetical protein